MKKWMIVIGFIIAIIGLTLYLRPPDTNHRQALRVYVPCGMTIPFKELGMAYEKQYRNIKVETTFDNANVLVRLILDKGKIPDVFISPGKKEIGMLQEKGFIEEGSVKPFGEYELILIAPSKSSTPKGLPDILNESVKAIAVSNPDFNSIGAYAAESLKSLGYWDKIQNKILLTNTPIEALTYVATSKADAGIHYNACPFQTNADKVAQGSIRIIATLPSDSHEPIHSYAGILRSAQNKNGAGNFIDFMFSKKGNNILSQYGIGKTRAAGASQPQNNKAYKVIVEAYYPFNEEHVFMKEYLESLAGKYKEKVKIECIDFRSDEGYVRWRKAGLSCGGILINGKNKFTINVQGQPKEVEFIKRLDIFWTKEELEKAIEQELEK